MPLTDADFRSLRKLLSPLLGDRQERDYWLGLAFPTNQRLRNLAVWGIIDPDAYALKLILHLYNDESPGVLAEFLQVIQDERDGDLGQALQPYLDKLNIRTIITPPIAQPLVPQLNEGTVDCPVADVLPTSITFANNSDRAISIYWLSYQCTEVFYITLQPGESYIQATFVTHPWYIRDAETQALLKQIVADGELSAVSVP